MASMCGRGGLDYSWQRIYQYMNLAGSPPEGGVRQPNLAPSTRRRGEIRWSRVPVVRQAQRGRCIDSLVWPLVPHWLKGELPKFSTANCRSESGKPFSETVRGKPAFRNAWKHGRRCLVPFSWFYEWDQRTRPRQPWRVIPVGRPVLVMAGLWDRSSSAEGEEIESFTIVTTEPNRLLKEIGHHRSPVILEPESWESWLMAPPEEAEKLIHPPADGTLDAEPVTTRVNNPEYRGEELFPA
jgi:putative SOS response-associated peptidase YedK